MSVFAHIRLKQIVEWPRIAKLLFVLLFTAVYTVNPDETGQDMLSVKSEAASAVLGNATFSAENNSASGNWEQKLKRAIPMYNNDWHFKQSHLNDLLYPKTKTRYDLTKPISQLYYILPSDAKGKMKRQAFFQPIQEGRDNIISSQNMFSQSASLTPKRNNQLQIDSMAPGNVLSHVGEQSINPRNVPSTGHENAKLKTPLVLNTEGKSSQPLYTGPLADPNSSVFLKSYAQHEPALSNQGTIFADVTGSNRVWKPEGCNEGKTATDALNLNTKNTLHYPGIVYTDGIPTQSNSISVDNAKGDMISQMIDERSHLPGNYENIKLQPLATYPEQRFLGYDNHGRPVIGVYNSGQMVPIYVPYEEASRLPSVYPYSSQTGSNGYFQENLLRDGKSLFTDQRLTDGTNEHLVIAPTNEEVFKKIMEELHELKKPQECNQDGQPCQVTGMWMSVVGGVQLDVSMGVGGGSSQLTVTMEDRSPPRQGIFCPSKWTIKGEAPFERGGPVIFTAVSRCDRKIASFIGVCRICNGVETVVGAWTVGREAKDCRDMHLTVVEYPDILRKESLCPTLKTTSV